MLRRISLMLVVALFAVACDETPTQPFDQPVADAPTLNYSNGPDEVAHLYRYDDHLVWTGLDLEKGLFAIFSTFPICGLPGEDLEPVNWQDNELPSEMNDAIMQVGQGNETYIYVGDCVGPINCAAVGSALASGMGKIRLHDNDVLAFVEDHPRNNAWGAVGQGKLTLAGSGEPARVNYVGNHVWDPSGDLSVHTDKINLTPDPR